MHGYKERVCSHGPVAFPHGDLDAPAARPRTGAKGTPDSPRAVHGGGVVVFGDAQAVFAMLQQGEEEEKMRRKRQSAGESGKWLELATHESTLALMLICKKLYRKKKEKAEPRWIQLQRRCRNGKMSINISELIVRKVKILKKNLNTVPGWSYLSRGAVGTVGPRHVLGPAAPLGALWTGAPQPPTLHLQEPQRQKAKTYGSATGKKTRIKKETKQKTNVLFDKKSVC